MSGKTITKFVLLMVSVMPSAILLAEEETSTGEDDKKPIPDATAFVTEHSGRFNGQSVNYTVTAGETYVRD